MRCRRVDARGGLDASQQAHLWQLLGAEAALGHGGQAVRRQGRVRDPRPTAARCAARPIGGEDDLPNQQL